MKFLSKPVLQTFLISGATSLLIYQNWSKIKNIISNIRYKKCKTINKERKKQCNYKKNLIQNAQTDTKIYIANKATLKEKIQIMQNDGIENCQIISDFDQTISSFYYENDINPTTFGIFQDCGILSKKFDIEYQKLQDYYLPIEKDHTIDKKLKQEKVYEWYEKTKDLYIDEKLTKNQCQDALNSSNCNLRYYFKEFISLCTKINLPFYIISGGISQFIFSLIQNQINLFDYDNCLLFSNELFFNSNNIFSDFHLDVISTKKQHIINHNDFTIKKNSLIFGDQLFDIKMAKKITGNKLAICFLNSNQEYQLEHFLEIYDIVIVGEGNFMIHYLILRLILKKKQLNLSLDQINCQEFKEVVKEVLNEMNLS